MDYCWDADFRDCEFSVNSKVQDHSNHKVPEMAVPDLSTLTDEVSLLFPSVKVSSVCSKCLRSVVAISLKYCTYKRVCTEAVSLSSMLLLSNF